MEPPPVINMQREAGHGWRRSPICWPALAWTVWLAIISVISLRVALGPGSHDVYAILATAGQHWNEQAELYWPFQPAQGPDHFRYSPVVAMVLGMWCRTPDGLGAILWRWLNAGVFLAGLGLWMRHVIPRPTSRAERGLLFVLVIPLAVGCLNNGQSNALVTGLLLLGTAAFATERDDLAAFLIALATVLKVYPVALGLLLTLLRPTRFGLRLGAALLLLAALPFCFVPAAYVWDQQQHWLTQLYSDDRSRCAIAVATCDWRLILRSFGLHVPFGLYMTVQILTLGLMGIECKRVYAVSQSLRNPLNLTFALATVWMTVFGPATESCTYILLAPALAWTILDEWCISGPAWRHWLPTCGLALFTLHQAVLWFPGGGRVRELALQPIAGFVLFGCLIARTASEQGRLHDAANAGIERHLSRL